MYASTQFLTSLPFLLPISSPPIPLLVTGLFRFSIIKRRPHSLARSPLCVVMHACTLLRSLLWAATVTLVRAMTRGVHTPCLSVSLCHQYRSPRLLGMAFYGRGTFSLQRMGDSPRFSLSQLAIRFTISSLPSRHYSLMNHQIDVITHPLASYSSVYHHCPFVIAFIPTASVPVHTI